MKLDKETLVKQRFWYLLALEVPLVLIATGILLLSVRAGIAKKALELSIIAQRPTEVKEYQNQAGVDKLLEKEKEITALQQEVWKGAWNEQEKLATWPDADLERKFHAGLFAVKLKVKSDGLNEDMTPEERSYLFRGNIRKVSEDTLEVVHTNAEKRQEQRTFHFSPGLVLTDESGEKPIRSFTELRRDQGVEVTFLQGKYFGDDFTISERQIYARKYGKQFADLRKSFLDARGDMLIQIKDVANAWENDKVPAVIKRRENWDQQELADPRTPWNIWYAQEDFWIQRELLRAMQKANDFVAHLEPARSNPDPSAEDRRLVFRNPLWELALTRKGDQVAATLKNISLRKQRLDVAFLVQLADDSRRKKWELKFDGEPLKPGEAAKPVIQSVDGEKPEGIFGVDQILTLDSAPVKRLDHLVAATLRLDNTAYPGHSHRTYPKGLRSREGGEKEEEQPPPAANPKEEARPARAPEADDDPRKRYSLVTPQFRRMPVALVLQIDQDSLHYVLTALEECPLRFQVTDVALTRNPLGVQVEEVKEELPGRTVPVAPVPPPKPKAGTGAKGSGSTQRRPIPYLPKMNPKEAAKAASVFRKGSSAATGPAAARPVPAAVSAPQPPPSEQAASVADEQGPVMELTIYGYVTLYERFPPKPEAAVAKPQESK